MLFNLDHKTSALRSAVYLRLAFRRAKREKIKALGQRPIVIGGCGRSGTSLLLSILSSHPNIFAVGQETMALCPDAFKGIEYVPRPDTTVPFQLWKLYREFRKTDIPEECQRWCEKTPRNVIYFQKILEYYGERVRILNIVRDGRDVITSRHPLDPSRFWVPSDRWLTDVAAGKRLENHPQVFTLRYEDLLDDFQETMQAICDFLDEPMHEYLLAYPKFAKIQTNRAWFGEARPITRASVARWQKPEFAKTIEAFLSLPKARLLLRHYRYLN